MDDHGRPRGLYVGAVDKRAGLNRSLTDPRPGRTRHRELPEALHLAIYYPRRSIRVVCIFILITTPLITKAINIIISNEALTVSSSQHHQPHTTSKTTSFPPHVHTDRTTCADSRAKFMSAVTPRLISDGTREAAPGEIAESLEPVSATSKVQIRWISATLVPHTGISLLTPRVTLRVDLLVARGFSRGSF